MKNGHRMRRILSSAIRKLSLNPCAGEELDTRACLDGFSVLYADILKTAPDHGLDAMEAVDELEYDQAAPLTIADVV